MYKILWRHDSLQWSYIKINFSSNLNYYGKLFREMGPWSSVHCGYLIWDGVSGWCTRWSPLGWQALLHRMMYTDMPLWHYCIVWCTMWCHYGAVNFLQNNHKVHSMPRSKIFTKAQHVSFGRARYGVLLFVSSMSGYCSAAVVTVLYVISNCTR